jgi:hypothetical protein
MPTAKEAIAQLGAAAQFATLCARGAARLAQGLTERQHLIDVLDAMAPDDLPRADVAAIIADAIASATAPAKSPRLIVPPSAILAQFAKRARIRASLAAAGELPLARAVGALYAQARNDGLTRRFGPDLIQQIVVDAFAPYRRPDDLPDGCDAADLAYGKATGDPRAEKYRERVVVPAPIVGAVALLKDGDRAALNRLRKHLDPPARELLEDQFNELARGARRHGRRRQR